MYQPQYAWNLAFFHNWRASRPGIDRWRLFDMFAKLALNYQIVVTKKRNSILLKKNEIIRKPEKRIRKLGRKKDISWFQRKLDCEMWPCLTFCWNMIGLAVKRWLITFYQFFRGRATRTVLCASQTTALPTACQGKGRTGSAWNIDCFDFKGKRTLLNCCWFKLIHVWFCDAVKVRSG